MAQTYNKHTWSTKEPITKTKMQNIEDGIKTLDVLTDTHTSDINTLESIVGYTSNEASVSQSTSVKHRINGLDNRIKSIENTGVGNLNTRLEDVEEQIKWARGNTEPRPNLSSVLETIRTSITNNVSTINDTYGPVKTEVENARKGYGSLLGKIDYIDNKIDSIEGAQTTLGNEIGPVKTEIANALACAPCT